MIIFHTTHKVISDFLAIKNSLFSGFLENFAVKLQLFTIKNISTIV